MIFPQAMLRLVWFVQEEKLADSLQLLSETGAFHLTAHYQLGDSQNIEPIKQDFTQKKHIHRILAAQNLLQQFPENTLLNYRAVDSSGVATLPEGIVQQDNQIAFWIGKESPDDLDARNSVQANSQQLNTEFSSGFSESQCQLLIETASQIGCVGRWRIVDGWIPTTEERRITKLLQNEVLLIIPAERCGLNLNMVPSLFRRSRMLQGFAVLMGLYDTTSYRELDPTPLLAVGFTFMFGMMFADLGQGLLLFLLGFWMLRHQFPNQETGARIGWLLMPIGLSAALFGIAFGSLFSHEDWIPAVGFHPTDNVMLYLLSSVSIGIALICIGMMLGIFNAWRGGRLKERLWDNFGPIGLLFYLALILFVLSQITDHFILRNFSLIAAASGLLAMSRHYFLTMEGESIGLRLLAAFLESYDFVMKFIMQTFSFIRIAAFTFAHIALSTTLMIFIEMASGNPWIVWPTLILGNLFITLLEGLLVSIQAIRLHFFELFTKFISGGGIPFVPLGKLHLYDDLNDDKSSANGVIG